MLVLFPSAGEFVGEKQKMMPTPGKLGCNSLGCTWGAPGTQASTGPMWATRGQQGPGHGPSLRLSTLSPLGTVATGCHLLLPPHLPPLPAFHSRVGTTVPRVPRTRTSPEPTCDVTASPRRHRRCEPTERSTPVVEQKFVLI